jgi:hypothetical protein
MELLQSFVAELYLAEMSCLLVCICCKSGTNCIGQMTETYSERQQEYFIFTGISKHHKVSE